jgi:hypothetical protein
MDQQLSWLQLPRAQLAHHHLLQAQAVQHAWAHAGGAGAPAGAHSNTHERVRADVTNHSDCTSRPRLQAPCGSPRAAWVRQARALQRGGRQCPAAFRAEQQRPAADAGAGSGAAGVLVCSRVACWDRDDTGVCVGGGPAAGIAAAAPPLPDVCTVVPRL